MAAAPPHQLRAALESMTEGRSTRDLAKRARTISALYRSGAPSSQAIRDADDALAYALTRMPATYAAIRAALAALADQAPGFAPATLADFGCGPGTASWAAMDAFDSIKDVRLVDNSVPLMKLAEHLMVNTQAPVIGTLFGDMARLDEMLATPAAGDGFQPWDLVVVAYALVELSREQERAVVESLWRMTAGVLLIVEPGTPGGWARLMGIRSVLIDMGGTVLAPCPHHAACPVKAPDWCHFSQRLPRSRAHREMKDADAPFEDEKYAYLAVARPPVPVAPGRAARVLAPPMEDKAAVLLKLCEPDGALALRRIAKRDKDAYRAIRRAGWGDRVE